MKTLHSLWYYRAKISSRHVPISRALWSGLIPKGTLQAEENLTSTSTSLDIQSRASSTQDRHPIGKNTTSNDAEARGHINITGSELGKDNGSQTVPLHEEEQSTLKDISGFPSDGADARGSKPSRTIGTLSHRPLRTKKVGSVQQVIVNKSNRTSSPRTAGPWVTRIKPQLDPEIQRQHDSVPVQRVFTRGERRGLIQLVSSLTEVMHFAEAIKETPWTPAELNQEDSIDQEQHIKIEDFLDKDDCHNGERAKSTISDSLFETTTGRRVSNLSLLAGYIDLTIRAPVLLSAAFDTLLSELFNNEAVWYLESNGYGVEDVISWAWILEAESNMTAVSRFLVWTNRPMPYQRVPRAMFLALMRRNFTEPGHVQLLTEHLDNRLANKIDHRWEAVYIRFIQGNEVNPLPSVTQYTQPQVANYLGVEPWKTAIYLLMLIKFAMYSVPFLLPSLATMLCKEVRVPRTWSRIREDGLNFRASVSFAKLFNRAIVMMSKVSGEPFVNVPYQERAQFIIIRHMNTFQPPLTIGLEAYRAIISVQLRHRKTIKERLWTELKSRGWPPFREDKLGIDARKKDEDYSISRAQHGIRNLKEAGYASTDWEDSASILSGWDVNRIPTIQTRRVFLDRAIIKENAEIRIEHPSLWESRILATRTIEEAWAAFLNYVEEDLPPNSNVYLAMFEKIIHEQLRLRRATASGNGNASTAVAGDMPRTYPSSPNPRDQTYTPSPPPTFIDFYHRYRTYFPVLATQALCLLLPHADSLAQAYEFVNASNLEKAQKDILLRQALPDDSRKVPIESRILVAYIDMLSQFASLGLPNNKQMSALSHAIYLVVTQSPMARGPWRSLLKAIDKEIGEAQRGFFWLQHWHIILGILQRMEKARAHNNSDSFYIICSIFSRLVRLASHTSTRNGHHHAATSLDSEPDIKARTGRLLKGMFKRMVTLDLRATFGHKDTELSFLPLNKPEKTGLDESVQFRIANLLPQLLYTPNPATIHLLARLLGVIEDKQAVLELLRWMSMYHREIEAKATELANGTRQFRKVLIAVRIIMESQSVPFISPPDVTLLVDLDSDRAKDAKAIVEDVDVWGGWPTDKEVDEYMQYGLDVSIHSEAER